MKTVTCLAFGANSKVDTQLTSSPPEEMLMGQKASALTNLGALDAVPSGYRFERHARHVDDISVWNE